MANWQENAIEDLKELTYLKDSVRNLEEQIEALDAQILNIRNSSPKQIQVLGMGKSREDLLIELIDRKERLLLNCEVAQDKLKRMRRGMKALTKREQLVLNEFFVDRSKRYMENLKEKLGYEERQIYRLRNEALKKFTLSMFGVVDL